MAHKRIWKHKYWNEPHNCTDSITVTKILMLVEFTGNTFRFPSITIDSEKQNVDYESTFEAVSLGENRYLLKSELHSDHHTQMSISVQDEQFTILDGSIWIEQNT